MVDGTAKFQGKDVVRVAVVGNVDAGKSTLIGTLKSNLLDDGRGVNRRFVMKHRHEKESGRTSSTVAHLIGFDNNGKVLTGTDPKSEASVARSADRLISLIDMAGHEKYFKTTIEGVSTSMPDYALVLVNARQPPTHMTLHHLNLANVQGIPFVIVLTKTDGCPKDVLDHTLSCIKTMLRAPDISRTSFRLRSERDVETVVGKLDALVPLVAVSAVTGDGLDLLRKLLFALPKRRKHQNKKKRSFEFLVEDILNVRGVGLVVTGIVNAGEWKKGEPVFIGPMNDGSFIRTTVRSVQMWKNDVDRVWAGHTAAFALVMNKQTRKMIRKWMVLLKQPNVKASKTFSADICLTKGLGTPTIVKGKYETKLHILHISQTARLVDFTVQGAPGPEGNEVLRPGMIATAKFEFVKRPEYIRPGMRLVMRDGHVRGIGIVKDLH